MTTRHLALELARTIRHSDAAGVTDELDTPAGYTAWIHDQDQLSEDFAATVDARTQVIALRRAMRALFAQAVHPDPPGKPDDRKLDPEVALRQLNEAAAAVLRAPQLDWPDDGPHVRHLATDSEPGTRLLAELARAAIELLSGDDRARLRACPAPRCVRYFLQEHPRQAWCKPSCGNRARVSRYYQRHHESSTGNDSTP